MVLLEEVKNKAISMQGHESIENFADMYDLVMQLAEEYNVDIKRQAKERTKALGGYSQCLISSHPIGDEANVINDD